MNRLVPAFVVLLVLAPMAALPVAGAPSESSSGLTDAPTVQNDSNTDTDTVAGMSFVTAAATAGDGGTYLAGVQPGGTAYTSDGNGSLARLAPDGSVRWNVTFDDPTRTTAIVGLASGPAPGVYAIERVTPPDYYRSEASAFPPETRLVRFAPDGEVVWRQSLSHGEQSAFGRSTLTATADGGVAVVTATRTNGSLVADVQRVSSSGVTLWDRRFRGGRVTALTEAPNGDLLLGGQQDYRTAWVLRLGADGAVRQNVTIDSRTDRRILGLHPTADGGVLLGGQADVTFSNSDPWAARLDSDGSVLWSDVYGTPAREYGIDAVPTEDGLLLAHRQDGLRESVQLTTVTSDGPVGVQRVETAGAAPTSMFARGDTAHLFGVERAANHTTAVRWSAPVPAATVSDEPTTPMRSNGTFYRGQDLTLSASPDASYGLYRLPTEYTEFSEPKRVRTLATDGAGLASVETATLSQGEYAVKTSFGWARLADGRITGLTTVSEAAFDLDEQHIWRAEPNRTVVKTYEGESRVRVPVETNPENITVRVGLTRLNGSEVGASALRAVLAPEPDAGEMVTAHGRTYGTVALSGDANVTLDAGALPAGLYRLTVGGLAGAEASESEETRLVVVHEERPLAFAANETTLSLTGEEVATNLTVAGVDNGIGALRVAANTSGDGVPRLDLELGDALELRSARGSSGLSSGGHDRPATATTATESMDAESPNGSFVVGTLTVERSNFHDGGLNGTWTVETRLAFAVDEDGVPYSPPEPVTVTLHITPDESAADDEGHGRERSGHEGGGSASASGSVSA